MDSVRCKRAGTERHAEFTPLPKSSLLTLSKPTLNALHAPQHAGKGRALARRTAINAVSRSQESPVGVWGLCRERHNVRRGSMGGRGAMWRPSATVSGKKAQSASQSQAENPGYLSLSFQERLCQFERGAMREPRRLTSGLAQKQAWAKAVVGLLTWCVPTPTMAHFLPSLMEWEECLCQEKL
jgi:hypothetical protein